MDEGKTKVKIECDAILLDPLEKNILLERYEFYQRCQKSEENFYTFLENIQNLAENCEFHGEEKDLLIRDRFVCGLNDKDLQSSIISTGGNPSVEKVINLCQKYRSIIDGEIKVEELNVDDKDNDCESENNDIEDDGADKSSADCIDNDENDSSQSTPNPVDDNKSKFWCKYF